MLPDGIQVLGAQWFKNSEIQSVTIPASVREIGADAFHNCYCLKHVIFAPGSELEKVGPNSFCNIEIEKIIIPKNVTEIKDNAFDYCKKLEEVVFEEGCKLKTIE